MRTARALSLTKVRQPKITEKVFQSQVRKAAIVTGWRFFHVWNSMKSPAGFPDCVMTKKGRIIFAELKSDTGKLSPDQEAWIADLKLIPGAEVFVLRPNDFDAFWEVLRKG